MLIKQHGGVVVLSRIVGGLLMIWGGVMLVSGVAGIPVFGMEGNLALLGLAAVLSLIGVGVFCMGWFWFAMFPDTEFRQSGLSLLYGCLRHDLRWDEVGDVVETTVASRPLAILLRQRGGFVYQLYGLFWARRINQPVVLVSARSVRRGELEALLAKYKQ